MDRGSQTLDTLKVARDWFDAGDKETRSIRVISRELSLFIGTFTTLLAIINPFEVMPVYLKLLEGKDAATHREVAWKSCFYALLLSLFFLIFGTLILRVFGVPLAMVRIVGGIILVKIGFELFRRLHREGWSRLPRRMRISPSCRSQCR